MILCEPKILHGNVKQITETLFDKSGKAQEVIVYCFEHKRALFQASKLDYTKEPIRPEFFDSRLKKINIERNRVMDAIRKIYEEETNKDQTSVRREIVAMYENNGPQKEYHTIEKSDSYGRKIEKSIIYGKKGIDGVIQGETISTVLYKYEGDHIVETKKYINGNLKLQIYFDAHGNPLKKNYFSNNGELFEEEIFQYDQNKTLICYMKCNMNTGKKYVEGEFEGRYKYLYDKEGNWIKQIEYQDKTISCYKEREILYYSNDHSEDLFNLNECKEFKEYCKNRRETRWESMNKDEIIRTFIKMATDIRCNS